MELLDHTRSRCSTDAARLLEKFGLRACAETGATALYRSRELSQATNEDVDSLANLGIQTIYDLRKPAERERLPEPPLICNAFEVRTCPIDLQSDEKRTHSTMATDVVAAYGQPGERMNHLYSIMAAHADAILPIVLDIIAADAPVLVHCANGKDRAGIVCASVQRMLGVHDQTVVDDYLITNICNAEMNRRDLARYAGFMQTDEVDVLAAMFEARESYLSTFFACIDAQYGSFEQWIAAGA
ncbi:MAG: tyrosine-protein phosphatase [Raoultibacter sp.]